MLEKGNYYLYRHVCQLIDSCNVERHPNYFIVEIDIEQNQKLVNNLCTKLWVQKLGSQRIKRKKGHGYKIRNLFYKFKVFK